jgi:hypothetical protein
MAHRVPRSCGIGSREVPVAVDLGEDGEGFCGGLGEGFWGLGPAEGGFAGFGPGVGDEGDGSCGGGVLTCGGGSPVP